MKKITELKIQKVRAWIKDGLKPDIILRGTNEPIEAHRLTMHSSGAAVVTVSHADQLDPAKVTKVWGYEIVFDPEDILAVGVETDGITDDEEDT